VEAPFVIRKLVHANAAVEIEKSPNVIASEAFRIICFIELEIDLEFG